MNDVRLGRLVHSLRVRKGWRQDDLAARARVSQATIWRIEAGHLDELVLKTIRRVCATLEISADLQPRGRGADLDRLINARHTALHEAVTRHLATALPDWIAASEVSFNIYGERGIIDILLWHPGHKALLIIELKTELVDPGELLATMDIRRRLAADIVASRGWQPATVSTWVIVARSRTNERRLAQFRSMLRSAFPADGRAIRTWLRNPVGSVAALSLWEGAPDTAPVHRVSAPRRRRPRHAPATGVTGGPGAPHETGSASIDDTGPHQPGAGAPGSAPSTPQAGR